MYKLTDGTTYLTMLHAVTMSECVLCKYAGSRENEVVVEVMSYISESVGRVGVSEISKQVRQALNAELNTELTDEDVRRHIMEHTLDQRVVLGNILKDLIEIAHDVKGASILRDDESGTQAVDTKALMAYLKTVDQITSIYKMECMRTLYK